MFFLDDNGVTYVIMPVFFKGLFCRISDLVGGFKHLDYFSIIYTYIYICIYIYGIILPIDELIFFRVVETTNQ